MSIAPTPGIDANTAPIQPGGRTSVPVVAATGLSKRYGATQALREVDIEVGPGTVRALVGRNGAGKSTLVSILTGMTEPDEGQVRFNGEPAPRASARGQWQSKVACVYQHPKVVPTLSCAENLFLNDNMRERRLISWTRMRREARRVFDHWELPISVDAPAESLGVGHRQLLEIAKAVTQGSRFLILDEPTAKLDGREVDKLFVQIRLLQSRGVGVLFISHHLEEIFEICGEATVLRDGRATLQREVSSLSQAELVEAMVGSSARALEQAATDRGRAAAPLGPARLTVKGLSLDGAFSGISFEIRGGECLGIAGQAGSGKEEIGEAVAGLRPVQAGSMSVDGERLPGGDVAAHIQGGVGFVPQDRHREGLVLGMTVGENLTMAITDLLGWAGFMSPAAEARRSVGAIKALDIKTTGHSQPVSGLSGGNQQKVVLGRALARAPRALVLINPTSGVDVASKAALFKVIREVLDAGTAVLVVSDELDELELCDRVIILRSGRQTTQFARPWTSRDLVSAMEGVQP